MGNENLLSINYNFFFLLKSIPSELYMNMNSYQNINIT